jgi:hypothetical protein
VSCQRRGSGRPIAELLVSVQARVSEGSEYLSGPADLRERFGRRSDAATLRAIPFLIDMGADDRSPADLPRQWDPYLGDSRVARVQAFVAPLW